MSYLGSMENLGAPRDLAAVGPIGVGAMIDGESAMVERGRSFYTSAMALSIKSDEADRLARDLAAETGETLTEAVVTALRERLDRQRAMHGTSMRARLARLAGDVAAMPVIDTRTPQEIVGYDEDGLPR
jgi:antitoxin VapB